jgi:alkylated DNA repair dioxygenase AlkB
MDLFENSPHQNNNILPKDGNVVYYGKVMLTDIANDYFNILLQKIEWKNDEAMIMGKHIITKRKVAWYGDETYNYTYSKITKQALLWTPELLQLKQLSEQLTNSTYNSCLLNLYHNGSEGMAWHSDGEKALKEDGAIASLSFGAERKFAFKHKKSAEVVDIILQHGSLLLMKDNTQKNWLHRLPPTKKIHTPRINLTFRTVDVK